METLCKVTKAAHKVVSACTMWGPALTRQRMGAGEKGLGHTNGMTGQRYSIQKTEIDLAPPFSSLHCFRAQTKKSPHAFVGLSDFFCCKTGFGDDCQIYP